MSQPPNDPGSPSESWGGNQNPGGYPPPGYRAPAPPPGYGGPEQPGYGAFPQPGYGAPPPPPGYGGPPPAPGYGAPGGYGAPPPGYGAPSPGYGAPPPGYGPAQQGFGAPPGQQFSAGEAFNWAWNKFSKNAATLIVPTLVYLVILGVIGGVMLASAFAGSDHQTVTNSGDGYYQSSTSANLTGGSIGIIAVGYLLLLAVGAFMQAAMLSGALEIADGRPVSIGSFFRPRNLGSVILAALLVAVLTGVGYVLFVIPGLIFAFFAYLTIPFVIDRSLSPVDGLKASIQTVRSNVGGALVSFLVQLAVVFVGQLLCGVGLIAAIPIVFLIQVYTYRRLSGGQVAPLTV